LDLPVIYNHTPVNTGRLRITGAAHDPTLTTSLAPSNRLFLRPTCVGAASTRVVELSNPGRVAAGWRWVVSRKLAGVVAISPEVWGRLKTGAMRSSHAWFKQVNQLLVGTV
jgi:hypothetical protein